MKTTLLLGLGFTLVLEPCEPLNSVSLDVLRPDGSPLLLTNIPLDMCDDLTKGIQKAAKSLLEQSAATAIQVVQEKGVRP